jgi:chromosome partitioning protein
MGRALAVVSQKGGVGKTTTAVNLAAAFARRGVRTLLADLDPQGSVRYGVSLRPGHPTRGVTEILDGELSLEDAILPTPLASLDVLLVGGVSDGADHAEFQRRLAEGEFVRELLSSAISRYELVIVDTPPGLGPIVQRVLTASRHVIVPLQCEPLALQTTPQILRGLQQILDTNDALTLDGILLTMHEENNPVCERVAAYVRANVPPDLVFDLTIPRSLGALDAFAAGQPVVLRTPEDPASRAYVQLATVLAERFAEQLA